MEHSAFGTQFYPTPLALGVRMVNMIKWDSEGPILDVSAGKGDLLAAAAVRNSRSYWKMFKDNEDRARDENGHLFRPRFRYENFDYPAVERLSKCEEFMSDLSESAKNMGSRLWAIEIDPDLQNVLRGRGYRVIGTDFFSYSGASQPSYILMNPPFESGAQFLLRAIDYLYSGQICCQLNAQTLLNPYSLERQALVKKLKELNATIEYFDGQYINAERPTGVQIALVYIDKRKAMDTVFDEAKDQANDHVYVENVEDNERSLVSSDRIVALVEHYEAQKTAGVELLVDFHQKCARVPFVDLTLDGFVVPQYNGDPKYRSTEILKAKINLFLSKLRDKHWTQMMDDSSVTRWLTKDKKEKYRAQLTQYSAMDFTVGNIRSFVSQISAAYPETLSAAIEDVFDEFTVRNSYHEDTKNNVHYFSGWLSNKSHYVNKKVVLPRMSSFDSFFGKWRHLDYRICERLSDFEKVMGYFEGGKTDFTPASTLIDRAVDEGQTSRIETEFFWVTVYKKGTMHLTFKSEDLRRRFNVFVGTRRAYLPPGYASKSYGEMDAEEQRVVAEFEGEKAYKVDTRINPFGSNALGFGSSSGAIRIAA